MEPYKKRLHLDRTEVVLILGMMILMFGLTFTLGVMVGSGFKSVASHSDETHHEEKAHGESAHHGKPKSADGHGRKPASESASPPANASEMKKAFRESKQKALNEQSVREATATQKPKSVVDAEAHFETKKGGEHELEEKAEKDVTRKPASVEVAQPKGEVAESGKVTVRKLFERKPAAIDQYSPTPGSYTVQVASYPSEDESRAKLVDLRKGGFNDAYIQVVRQKNGDSWYRVSVGSYPSPAWAKKSGEKLVKRKLANDFVVRQVN